MKRPNLRDERGMTLVELLIASTAGVVVMAGITLTMIVTMRETNRVASHVDANQRARIAMTTIINELHSACVAPQIAPLQPESTGTLLSFMHQSGSAVAPTPVVSKISLVGTTLTQSDYAVTGAAPNWSPVQNASSTVTLMTNVAPISGSIPVFRYFSYDTSGRISATPLATPLEGSNGVAVQVNIAFKTAPRRAVSGDAGAETSIQDAALLRLTPPGFNPTTANLPCQ